MACIDDPGRYASIKEEIMRQSLLIIFIVLLFLSLSISNTDAGNFPRFGEFYTVDEIGSTTAKSNFEFTDVPVLYVQANSLLPGTAGLESFWVSPNSSTYLLSTIILQETGIWFTLDNWSIVREAGVWNIEGDLFNYAYGGPIPSDVWQTDSASISFSVNPPIVPEPISAILFATGGTLLAGRRYINRRKA